MIKNDEASLYDHNMVSAYQARHSDAVPFQNIEALSLIIFFISSEVIYNWIVVTHFSIPNVLKTKEIYSYELYYNLLKYYYYAKIK